MTTLEILALLPLIFWVLLALDRSRAWPRESVLPEVSAAVEGPGVVAIVPARDEAAVLPETLPALLAQAGARLSVILVDDQSADGTGEAARAAAEAAGLAERLTVLQATATPPGWAGKVHALACGVAAAEVAGGEEPEWLLFTDADIQHRPGSVAGLLAKAAEGDGDRPYDLVSVMARLHAATFWERLLIPPFVFFFHLLYPFRRVCDPRSAVAAAAGGCVLVRRRLLAAAGGVGSIRGAVIDDVALARQVKAAGGRLWLGFDPGIVSVRPYRGLGQLWGMVARSAFVQLRYRWDLLLLTLAGLAIFVAAPPFVTVAAGLRLLGGGAVAADLTALLAACAAWIFEVRALGPSVRHHRVPSPFALGLPFAAVLYGLMTASSAWSHLRGHGVRWKGRSYSAEEG